MVAARPHQEASGRRFFAAALAALLVAPAFFLLVRSALRHGGLLAEWA
jgi:hypothetical protein